MKRFQDDVGVPLWLVLSNVPNKRHGKSRLELFEDFGFAVKERVIHRWVSRVACRFLRRYPDTFLVSERDQFVILFRKRYGNIGKFWDHVPWLGTGFLCASPCVTKVICTGHPTDEMEDQELRWAIVDAAKYREIKMKNFLATKKGKTASRDEIVAKTLLLETEYLLNAFERTKNEIRWKQRLSAAQKQSWIRRQQGASPQRYAGDDRLVGSDNGSCNKQHG